jgi:hypothetical protein
MQTENIEGEGAAGEATGPWEPGGAIEKRPREGVEGMKIEVVKRLRDDGNEL